MASPRHIPTAARSDSPPLMETCDKENICQDRDAVSDCPTMHREGAASTKRKKKPGGFNLRKSIAWNPAFFTEEGVLDNMELTKLSGSQMKPNRSPGSGVGGGTVSPLCRFGRSGTTSVLKEVAENSRGKLPAKFRSTENKGRKLFSPAKTSERDERRELAGTQDKRSARSIQKCIPRPPAGNSQKNVLNSSATSQMFRTPKKSQPPIPMVPRSTPPSTNMSKPNKKLPPVKTEHPRKAEGLQLKSKVNPTSSTKPSGPNIEKDVAAAVTAIHEEASSSRKCESFSIYSQNRPSGSYGVPASTFAKPSALRMPSPSVGFFAQGKAPVTHGDTPQGNAKSYTGNTSSLVKPPRYKQPEDLKGRLFKDRLSNGDTSQGNAKSCFTGNTSSLVKPPRYKQPEDLKSGLSLTKQLPTNSPAASKPPVHPVTNESTLNTLASSLPGLEHANVCSARVSLSKGVITDSAKSGNTDNQQMRKVDCFCAGSGATTQPLRPENNDGSRNGMPNAYGDASHVEGRGIINRIEPIKDPHSLKAVCSSTIESVEDSCSHEAICSSTMGSKLSSCISSQVCSLDDLDCQSKSDNCASVAIDLENSLFGDTTVTVSLSEGNNCIPGPDLRDFDSCNQQNTAECSTLMEPVKSTICADRVPQCGSSIDIKPALADSTSNLYGSLCYEVQPTSSEEPNTDDRMELDSDNSLIAKEAQLLHVGCECDHDYRSTERPSMKQAESMPCVDQETRAADVSDRKIVTIDSKTETHDSLAVERQPVLLEEPNTEDDMELDTNGLSALEDASPIEKNKAVNKPGTNTILKDHLKHLVPFTEQWLAAMEACGEEVLEQKTGAVQNSPTDKTAPEPSPWSPVKRKAQDVGPFDCTKYSKSVRTSDTP